MYEFLNQLNLDENNTQLNKVATDGKHLFVASPLYDWDSYGWTGPYILTYENNTAVNILDTMPTSIVNDISLCQDYLAIVCNDAPRIMIYKRNIDNYNLVNVLNTMPTDMVYNSAFSHDGVYFALIESAEIQMNLRIYKFNGTTYDLLNTIIINSSTSFSMKFTDNYLVVVHEGGIIVYKRNGDTFTSCFEETSMYYKSATFNEAHLAIASENSPYLIVYKNTNDVFASVSIDTLTKPANDCSFSPDNSHLVIAHNNGISIYDNTFTKLTLSESYLDDFTTIAFNPIDFSFMAGAEASPSYIVFYKSSGNSLDVYVITFNELTQQKELKQVESISLIAGTNEVKELKSVSEFKVITDTGLK